MQKKYEIIERILEVSVFLYIIFMFLSKGESIRIILLFSNFFLWILTLKYRGNKKILIEPISLLFWAFIITIIISAFFSIDKWYSLDRLREDPLKSALLFPVMSTVLADEKRLRRLNYVFFAILLFTISVGYYSYWAHDLPLMTPDTPLKHQWHNRFAVDLNTLFPFSLILLFINKKPSFKIVIATTIIMGIIALVLSTSRGGLIAFFCMLVIWTIYGVKKKRISIKLILGYIVLIILILGITVYYAKSDIKDRFLRIKQDCKTISSRTLIWSPLISAAAERPFFGWGYGSKIFRMDLPFEKTPYKVAPAKIRRDFRHPDNAFLKVLFHQGFVGLVIYVVLLFAAIKIFWEGAYKTENIRSYIFIACTSILISTYLIHSIVESTRLLYLTLILGVGVAARNLRNENSHS